MSQIYNKLKQLRNENNYTQQYMADRLAVDRSTYIAWENNARAVPSDYLIELACIFGVSTDYLLGISTCRSVDNDYISKETGLNDKSIDTLKRWVKYEYDITHKTQMFDNIIGLPMPLSHSCIDTLNFLLENYHDTETLLAGIQDYMQTNYKIPVYHTGNYEIDDGIAQPQLVRPTNEFDNIQGNKQFNIPSVPLLTLARSTDNLHDNIQMPIDSVFLETVALKTIEKAIQELKETHENENK